MKLTSTISKTFALFVVLMLVLPSTFALDYKPTLSADFTYISEESTTIFYGNANDHGDNAGINNVRLYEVIRDSNGNVLTHVERDRKVCSQTWADCDFEFEVTKDVANSYEFFIVAKDNGGHEVESETFEIYFDGLNTAPVITAHTPNSREPTIYENETQKFTVDAFDADGDDLTFRWFLRFQDEAKFTETGVTHSEFTFDFSKYNESTSTIDEDITRLNGRLNQALDEAIARQKDNYTFIDSSNSSSQQGLTSDDGETNGGYNDGSYNNGGYADDGDANLDSSDSKLDEDSKDSEVPSFIFIDEVKEEAETSTSTSKPTSKLDWGILDKHIFGNLAGDKNDFSFAQAESDSDESDKAPKFTFLDKINDTKKDSSFTVHKVAQADGMTLAKAESRFFLRGGAPSFGFTGTAQKALTISDGNSEMYSVYVIVTDGYGGTDAFYWNLTVLDTVPNVDFTWNPEPVLGGIPVQFTDLSTAFDGVESWTWDFDNDGIIDTTEQNPDWTYNSTGDFEVNLTVTDSDGSTASAVKNITITRMADLLNPEVIGLTVTPNPATLPGVYTTGDENVTISATVTDNQTNDWGLDTVVVLVTEPDGTQTTSDMTVAVDDVYEFVFDITQVGTYKTSITSTDLAGNVNDSESTLFEVLAAPVFGNSTTTITAPNDGAGIENGTQFEINITVSADDAFLTACNATLSFENSSLFDVVNPAAQMTQTLGDFIQNESKNLSWVVGAIDLGTSNMIVTTTCAQGGSSTDTIEITILEQNLAPAFNNLTDEIFVKNDSVVVDASAEDHDAYDDEPFTYTTDATFGLINSTTGIFTHDFGWKVTYNYASIDTNNAIVTFFDITNGGQIDAAYNTHTFKGTIIVAGQTFDFTVDEVTEMITFSFGSYNVGDSFNIYENDVDAGVYAVEFNASDGTTTTSQTIDITILDGALDTNAAPTLEQVVNQTVLEGQLLTINLNGTDAENDTLIFGTNATFGVLDEATGEFNWTPNFIESGDYTFEFSVADGRHLPVIITVNITVNESGIDNNPPVFDALATVYTINENETLVIDVNATDLDGDDLTFGTNVTFGTINSTNGKFNWTPSFTDAGNYTVEFTVSDGVNLNVTTSVLIEVLDAPFGDNIAPTLELLENFTVRVNDLLRIDLNATDVDNDILLFGTNATLGTFDTSTGVFAWIPDATDVGNHTVEFSVRDPYYLPVKVTTTIEVLPDVNVAPVLDAIGNQSTTENVTLTIKSNATDADGDTLIYFTNATFGTINSTNGEFNWTPSFIDSGNYTVEFGVSDGVLNDTEIITIEVLDDPLVNNAPPVFDVLGNFTVDENTELVVDLNATDVDNDTLVFSTDATFGTLDAATGEFNWTPQNADVGEHNVTFGVSDGINPEVFTTTTITVNPTSNVAPTLDSIGNQTVNENSTLIMRLNGTDANNDTLTFSWNDLSGSITNATFNNTNGLFNWTPTFDNAGNYTVEFCTSDGILNACETITIEVVNVNRVPTAQITTSAPNSGVVPLAVQFNSTATGGDGELTYSWDFNSDGLVDATGKDVQFTFVAAGVFTVTLNVTDEDGDSVTDTTTITSIAQVHDVSVDTLTHTKQAITTYLDDTVVVTSQVTNNGNVDENITVVLEVNGIAVNTTNVVLTAGNSGNVVLNFVASELVTNSIVVRAMPVPGETDMIDNFKLTTDDVWSVEDIISLATRELFIDTNSTTVGTPFNVFLPLQNNYNDLSFDDLLVTLSYNNTAFTVAPSAVQLADFTAGGFVLVQWTLTPTTAGNYTISASLGNNEITDTEITSKQVVVA